MLLHVRLHHQDGPILWPRVPLRTHATSVASQDTSPEIVRQDQKQLALPSTGHGNNSAPQLQCQAVNLWSWPSKSCQHGRSSERTSYRDGYPSLLIQYPLMFYSIQVHRIHSSIRSICTCMHDVMHMNKCIPSDSCCHYPLEPHVATPLWLAHNVPVEIEGLSIPMRLPSLFRSSNIDLILGMDWLKAHVALIDCAAKTVQLLHPSDQIVNYSVRTIQKC